MTPDLTFLLQLVINGLVVGSIYALVATGFVIIHKSTGALNLAQGEFLMVGAYICLHAMTAYRLPFLAALPITLAFTALLGILIERVVLRPLLGSPVISVIMVTLGLAGLLRSTLQFFFSTDTRAFPELFPSEPVMLGVVPVSQGYLWSVGGVAVLLTALGLFFRFSRAGLALRATASNQQTALSMGISVKRMFALSWCIATVVSAIGGVLLGAIRGGVDMSLGHMGLKVLPVVILGGLDSVPGAIVGGLLIGVLENLTGGYLDPLLGGGVKEVVPYVVLVFILMVKPSGLFGRKKVDRV
jgi:branched-chain amino acid transport system permease protein